MRPEVFILLAMLSPARMAARDFPAEKVWTNLDVETLRATSPISIFEPGPTTEPTETESSYQPYVKEKDPAWYAEQIDSMRGAIEEADAEIQTIENIMATGEGISGTIPLDTLAVGISPAATIEIRESEKSAWEAEIESLQDQARANLIPAEAWR
jgi:hypothetical protein